MRTKTLVKNCIVTIDASPFAAWYLNHYGISIGNIIVIQVKKQKILMSKLVENPKELLKDWNKGKKIELLIQEFLSFLLNKDYMPV